MPKKEAPLEYLQQFIPEGSAVLILDYLHQHKVHLTITRERKTVLGDYRHATNAQNHRISINGNLNKYSFVLTLIHEIAHLATFIQFGNAVLSHGKEWKSQYRQLLQEFIHLGIFPADIITALKKSFQSLPASSCVDDDLMRVLKNYDNNAKGHFLVEQIPEGALFKTDDGKIYQKGKKIRKRFQCVHLSSGQLYLFSPVYKVRSHDPIA
jgi:SprT protein